MPTPESMPDDSLAHLLGRLHVEGIGLAIAHAVWLPAPETEARIEEIQGALLVVAETFDQARRALLHYVIAGARPRVSAATPPTLEAPVERTPETLDLRQAKMEATQSLPPGHPAREALLREPDELPAVEGRAKIETFLRLLFLRNVNL